MPAEHTPLPNQVPSMPYRAFVADQGVSLLLEETPLLTSVSSNSTEVADKCVLVQKGEELLVELHGPYMKAKLNLSVLPNPARKSIREHGVLLAALRGDGLAPKTTFVKGLEG